MFDVGWTEIVVIACVAIIVVGPKDLPRVLRTVGKTVGNLRRMAGDFQKQFDDALKEAELDEVKKMANARIDLDKPRSTPANSTPAIEEKKEPEEEFDLSWMETDDPGAIAEEVPAKDELPAAASAKPASKSPARSSAKPAAAKPAASKTSSKAATAKAAAKPAASPSASKAKPASKAPAASRKAKSASSAAKPAAKTASRRSTKKA